MIATSGRKHHLISSISQIFQKSRSISVPTNTRKTSIKIHEPEITQSIDIVKSSIGVQLFLWAMERGDLERMKEFISKNPSILQHSADDDYEMLRVAQMILPQHPEVMEFLISNNVDIHSIKDSLLIQAAKKGHSTLIELILNKYPDLLMDPHKELLKEAIKEAIQNGQLRVVQLLSYRIPDIHEQPDDFLFLAAKQGQLDMVKFFIAHSIDEDHPYNRKSLCEARKKTKNPKVAEYLKSLCKVGIRARIANFVSKYC